MKICRETSESKFG